MRDFKITAAKCSCYVLSLILALCIACTVFTTVSSFTLGSNRYVNGRFTDSSVMELFASDYTERLKAAAEKNGIPYEALSSLTDESVLRLAQSNQGLVLTSGVPNNIADSVSIPERIDAALDAYIEDGGKKLTAEKRQAAADDILQAFNDSYAIDNQTQFAPLSGFFGSKAPRLALVSIFAAAVCALAVAALNGFRRKALTFIGMAALTSGAVLVTAFLTAAVKAGGVISHFTAIDAYNTVIYNCTMPMLLITVAAGALLIAIGVFMEVVCYRYYSIRYRKNDFEQKIQDDLIF